MNRTTIDYGIDLGTTNSAIALLKGVTTEIIKNNRDHDITPSAVHISKRGVTDVGFNAKQRMWQWPDDTFGEFKRRMGTDHVYYFESADQRKRAEDLSAEVLKSLKDDVQRKNGEVIEAAVITVPAAFELHQCDATRKAAQLAGFKESPLLQEPVAAALAYGFQIAKEKAFWLVYDFGGGTFDAAIIKAEEGTIHVVNHGGDNFLGGSDMDWAIVEKLIAPRVAAEFGLQQFDRAHCGKGGRWRQAFARLKFAAEQAKIDLTQKEKVFLDTGYASNLKDESSGRVVVEECDLEITRGELVSVTEPIILRSVEICKRILQEKNLGRDSVEKVILVGGPTLAPYFREILAATLGIPLDFSVDPLTVVARGAAVFAGTQRVNSHAFGPVPSGEFSIDLKHKPVGMDSAPMVGGKVSGPSTQDFTGFTLEVVNTKTQWRSGKISLRSDGIFIANLHVERGERNTFAIELFDPSGRKQKATPDTLNYTIGAVIDEQPVINSMGIALANNDYARFFHKGSGLPQRKTWPEPFHTVKPLKQGQSGEFLLIPVIEGENDLADRNRLIKVVSIKATDIRRDLPVGSEVEITLKMDESRLLWLEAYVPLLDEDFSSKIELSGRTTAAAEFLQSDFGNELQRFRQVKSKAASAGGETAEELVQQVEDSPLMEEVKESLAAANADPDVAAKCERLLLALKLKLDEAANALEWPALVAEAREWLGYMDRIAEHDGTEAQRGKAGQLADETETIIQERHADRLRKRVEQIERLYWEIAFTQPGFWVHQLQRMEKEMQKMSDQTRAARLLDQGRDCMSKNNMTGLQNVVKQLWSLLPNEIVQAAQRGYQSGLLW